MEIVAGVTPGSVESETLMVVLAGTGAGVPGRRSIVRTDPAMEVRTPKELELAE
jgi:hypothetical protein